MFSFLNEATGLATGAISFLFGCGASCILNHWRNKPDGADATPADSSCRHLLTLYLLGLLPAWFLIAGMFFSSMRATYPWPSTQREDIGDSVAIGAALAAIWPVGLPFTFCVTAFAEHGVWTQKP